jgi:hypothetical protein
MKLNCDAIICDKNKNWYGGWIRGFFFEITNEIKSKKDISIIKTQDFESISKYLENIGFNNNSKLAKTVLKSINVRKWEGQVLKDRGFGVLKLFLPNVIYVSSHNFLCENCLFNCKQSKNVIIFSCRKYINGKLK